MLRLIALLLVITALSLSAAWIADEPGRVVIDWSDYHIQTSLLVVLAGIAIAALLCMLLYSLLWAIIHSPRKWKRARLAKHQTLGLTALTETFAAIATQDIITAKKQLGRAQHYLPHQPLTLMLAAQVARISGNDGQAKLYLEQMLKAEGTEFMALRSLVENARRNQEDETALHYAQKAIILKPQDSWLITIMVSLYSKQGRAQNALQLIDNAGRKRYITKQAARELSAYVLYENARALIAQLRWDFAIAVLEDALRKLPGFVPASVLLAEAYAKQHEMKRALKIIGDAWKTGPHPALSELMLQWYDTESDRSKVEYKATKLAQYHPDNTESRLLLAQMAMKNHDAETALVHLKPLINDNRETIRICTMMAELEAMRGDSEQESHWLKRAGAAAPDTAWDCGNCHYRSAGWHLTCPNCSNVASSVWK